MFKSRISGLLAKASIVCRYLTALEAIKTDKEYFEATFQDIERYLNDNEWTLAKYWVDRIQIIIWKTLQGNDSSNDSSDD